MRGAAVKLRQECMGNPAGSWGLCYDEQTFAGEVFSFFIFENGEYDGFDTKEYETYLENICITSLSYPFTYAIQLSKDYEDGFFLYFFNEAKMYEA